MVRGQPFFVAIGLLGVGLLALATSEFLPREGQVRASAAHTSQGSGLRSRSRQDRDALWRYLDEVGAGPTFDLDEATRRVHLGTTHSINRRVNVRENWLQWMLGQIYEPLARTQNTQHLIDGGLADCSERSQILKTIAEQAGCACRFVGLQGHVVLEVYTQGRWRVADPDYGVAYPVDLAGLEGARGPVLICTQLANNGYDSATIDRYIDIVQTVEDNAALPIGSPLSPRLSAVERSCDVLVWAVPVACLAIGLLGIRAKHRNAWVAGVRRVEPRAGRPVRASWARLTAT